MRWSTNSDKLSALRFYQEMGFSCSFINGNEVDKLDEIYGPDPHKDPYKNPSSNSINNFTEQDLEAYTGIGIHLGGSCEIRAIDIDNFRLHSTDLYSHQIDQRYARYFFIRKCMALLGLPEDYEWVVETPNGWHIIISAPSLGITKAACDVKDDLRNESDGIRETGSIIRMSHIELLWDGFLVMPPSIGKYSRYKFYFHQPQKMPARVSAARLLDFICFYCGKVKYITYMTTYSSIPIIGNAHLFPHYELSWIDGSYYGHDGHGCGDICANTDFLSACKSPLGYNMRGVMLVLQDLRKNHKVEKELDSAIKLFRMANDDWGRYNLACLMAIGAMHGSTKELYGLLNHVNGFPDEYKDQLELLYLEANSESYEKYAIIDISTNENKRIDKIAILLTDSQGNILNKWFLKPDSVMLDNMHHGLNHGDYIAGCNLAAIEELVRHECEICGDSFSSDWVGVNSKGDSYTVHTEGNFLDAFSRPWIDIAPPQIDETDPFRRVYKIKDLIIKKLNDQ